MKKLRVAIIGQGRSGRDIHGAFFRSEHNDKYEVVAVVDELDFRRERAKQEFGCDVYADHRDCSAAPTSTWWSTRLLRTCTTR